MKHVINFIHPRLNVLLVVNRFAYSFRFQYKHEFLNSLLRYLGNKAKIVKITLNIANVYTIYHTSIIKVCIEINLIPIPDKSIST